MEYHEHRRVPASGGEKCGCVQEYGGLGEGGVEEEGIRDSGAHQGYGSV